MPFPTHVSNAFPSARRLRWPGLLAWLAGAWVAWALDGVTDLGSQAMPLVLASALASLWWPLSWSALACLMATLAFNFGFVTPRGSFAVTFHHDLVLLLTMLGVSLGVAALMERQRRLRELQQRQSAQLARLHALGESLAQARDATAMAEALGAALAEAGAGVRRVQVAGWPGGSEGARAAGDADAEALHACLTDGHALGPDTGRFESLPGVFLPLREGGRVHGAVALSVPPWADAATRAHWQALCDLAGQALARQSAQARMREAHEQVHDQRLRNTLLSAIAHDFRTPLASILSAATSLRDQDARLPASRRQGLAAAIAAEAEQLARLTDNTLQLARLGASRAELHCDWQSVAELLEDLAGRMHRRADGERVRLHAEPDLPLVFLDPVLVTQALENLLDNALRHGPPGSPVDLRASREGEALIWRVEDRGAGVPEGERDRIFEPFVRGERRPPAAAALHRGAGVGLALCRAVAEVHGGRMAYRGRVDGGACFEMSLPLRMVPTSPAPEVRS